MQDRKDNWTVGAWMTPNPISIAPSATVRAAFYKMRAEGFRHLPVVEDGQLVGMVTDRDLRRPDVSEDPDGWNEWYNLDEGYEVSHVMTGAPVTVAPGDDLEKALRLLSEHKYGALPVLDKHGALIGIFSTVDALRAFRDAMDVVGADLRRRTR